MQFVPWQNIADWHCKACGYCCKLYGVVITPRMAQYRPNLWRPNHRGNSDRFFIKRESDGSCAFLCKEANTYCCKLQMRSLKPAKSGHSKSFQNQNMAKQKRQLTITLVCDCTFTGIPCAAAYEGEPTWEFRTPK